MVESLEVVVFGTYPLYNSSLEVILCKISFVGKSFIGGYMELINDTLNKE